LIAFCRLLLEKQEKLEKTIHKLKWTIGALALLSVVTFGLGVILCHLGIVHWMLDKQECCSHKGDDVTHKGDDVNNILLHFT